MVFDCLSQGQFFLKESKCVFAQQQLKFLGHIVSARGMAPDPSKLEAMVTWPVPTTTQSLCGFLGLIGFYPKFICGYAALVVPLTTLFQKNNFHWGVDAQNAFDNLKHAMTQAPVLSLLDFSIPFTVKTDAYGVVKGVVLTQRDHPLAFFSKAFCPQLQHASIYVRELHAVMNAVHKWRQYLLGHPFTILTDHKSLKDLMGQVIQTLEQQVYLSNLLGYDYTIQYKSEKSNIVVDALSRVPQHTSGQYMLLSIPHFIFIDAMHKHFITSAPFQTKLQQVNSDLGSHPDFEFRDGLLFFNDRVWLEPENPFIVPLIEDFHLTPIGSHLTFAKTLHRVHTKFYWANMRANVKQFICLCTTCQQVKYETKRPAGLL